MKKRLTIWFVPKSSRVNNTEDNNKIIIAIRFFYKKTNYT